MNTKSKKRYKDIDFPFTCPLTGRKFESSKGLSVYVTKTLKLNHEEYYDTNINHRDSSCFFCGNKGKFISLSKGYRNLCNNQECVKKSFRSNTIEGFMYKNMCSFTLKKCIEFNGDYWHCNPIKYNETYIHPIIKLSAKDIWKKDFLKNKWNIDRGYNVLVIWESEYRKYPQQVIDSCIKFINEK